MPRYKLVRKKTESDNTARLGAETTVACERRDGNA